MFVYMIFKAYKYRIYPTMAQQELIAKHLGCSRYIYNYGLDMKIKTYQSEGKRISRFDIQKNLPILKKSEDTAWLKEVNSQSLQVALEHLEQGFTKFFRGNNGFPKFKSKHDNRQSFSVPSNTLVDWDKSMVSIPKFKEGIKAMLHRKFEGEIKSSTICKTPTNKYFISILVQTTDVVPEKKLICENQAIGIDLGIKTFAVLSNGVEIENPKHLRRSLKKLKRAQRKLCKKKKGSNNRVKSVRLLAILHEKVSNKRNDFLHKTSHHLVSNYATLCMETLAASNMMKNRKLSQALSDIAIGRFNEFINYKSEWGGINILRIGQFEPSSKLCSCGVKNNELKLGDRFWTCQSCNVTHNRDVLASNNIKRFAFVKLNTAGVAEINACRDMKEVTHSAQEANIL